MKKIKTIIDREPLGSDYIASKQNFNTVMKQVETLKSPVWKSGWFYGPIGMASVAITISIARIDSTEAKTESKESVVVQKINSPKQHVENLQAVNHEESQLAINVKDKEVKSEPEIQKPIGKNNTISTTAIQAPDPEIEPMKNNAVTPKVVEQTTTKRVSTIPHIGRNYTGNIAISDLHQPISVNDMIEVVEFSIHFNTVNGTDSRYVKGNLIPEDVIKSIENYNIGYMFFINDIKARRDDGAIITLLSMNFTATN